MPIDDRDLSADPTPTVVRPNGSSLRDSVPDTFPSEAESLLKHLKFGAARPDTGDGAATAQRPAGAPGLPLIPNYEIEGELGRGGMGVVYKARHAALRHTVAVKMILASAHAAPGEVARFVAEAEAVAAVKHPNVVQVFDLGVAPGPDGDRPYFVMEYVDGGTLASYLKEAGGRLSPGATAGLLEPVARGVNAANEAGIVHRDLKPGNILISECGVRNSELKTKSGSASLDSAFRTPHSELLPKVSDFGLAKRLSSDMTRTQAVMGTPAYMAPEQAGGKAKFVGPQADVYALGVILYQCLTGGVPFDDPDPWALISRVVAEAPEPPRARAPHVPRDIELICLKCLEKEPHHRYPTAADLADDLRRFLNHEAVSVRPIGPATKLARWARKRPWTAAAVAAGALVAASIPPTAVGVKARLDRKDALNAEMQKTADALTAEAAASHRAEVEANNAKVAAERAADVARQLADAKGLFALQTKLRNRAAARPPGWTAEAFKDLAEAVALARGDAAVAEDLRSVATTALLADDLFPADPVLPGMSGSVVATDPKTGLVAVGEFKSWLDCKVVLLDGRTGKVDRTLTFPTQTLWVKGKLVQDGARGLAFSADGARLYVGTRGGRIHAFDTAAAGAKPALAFGALAAEADRLAVSADGKTVYALGRPDDPVFAWDAATGERRADLTRPGEHIRGIAALPGGGLVAATGDKMAYWDANGNPRAPEPFLGADYATLPVVGPGSMLLVAANHRLEVYDPRISGPLGRFTDPLLRQSAHPQAIPAIAVHPSKAYAATVGSDGERVVRVWELGSGRLVGALAVPGSGPVRPAWSGDGEFLLATTSGRVVRWRLARAPGLGFACGTGQVAETATFLPDGRVASRTTGVGVRCEVVVGRAGGPSEVFAGEDGEGEGRAGLSADPGGRLALTSSSNGLCFWTPGPPLPVNELTKFALRYPRFGADGRTLWAAFGTREVRAVNPADRSFRGSWNNTVSDNLTGLGTIEAMAAGRAVAVVAVRDGSVQLLDSSCGSLGSLRVPNDPLLAVAVSADDALVAVGAQSGTLRLIRVADKAELPAVTAAHTGGVSAVAFGPGGLLATGGRDRAVRLWKRSGDRLDPLLTVSGLPEAVRELQFHPTDGRLLVLLDRQHAVRVWDVPTLRARLGEMKLGW